MRPSALIAIACALLPWLCPVPAPAAETPEGLEFFEAKIRPVLADRCFQCHSAAAKKVKGKLKLDSKEDLEKGGDTGKAIVPGDPDKSLLIKAIRYADEDLQMPPKEKLPDAVIHDFEHWVKIGAPYPASAKPKAAAAAEEDPRQHWSLRKPQPHAPPAVHNAAWPKNSIDAFILARLEQASLSPARPADKRTLIRRATFDLTGLPPTSAEVEAFENDPSPDAFAKVVDRLLASPHYGERWGRYWLDIARYADTKGYVFEEERRYPYSYTYRDWVVQALNQDMPYDQFLINQIAADLVTPVKTPNLAAEGFLTLGRRFLNVQADIIDDRLDVLMRGTQALTLTCARCHDHKFDPITQKDYYSLYGVFASTTEPADPPLLGQPANSPDAAAYEKEKAAREAEVTAYLAKRHQELLAGLRSEKELSAYLLAAHESRNSTAEQIRSLCQKQALRPYILNRWIDHLKKSAAAKDPVFAIWNALTALPEAELPAKSAALIQQLEAANASNAVILAAFKTSPAQSLQDVAHRYAKAFAAHDQKDPICQLDQEALRQVLRGEGSPIAIPLADVEHLFLRDDQAKMRELRKKVAALAATHPGAPARAMALADLPTPVEPHIFKRGNPGLPGPAVRRQFVEILSPPGHKPFSKGSGRLELAQAIASKENPLTARVIVNRVWLGHFGYGLVRTPSDFGTRGDPPTHPELLDQLAIDFMNSGWSLKRLHRQIMLSATYQQSSDFNAAGYAADPENRLVWRMNRRRLDFEGTRDALLFAAGRLDPVMGGRAIDISNPDARRRTLYGFIDRQNLPGMFRSFDFASPDTHSPQRFTTTVPQQALFLMNSPFVIAQAKALAHRADVESLQDPAQRVAAFYRDLFQRPPRPDELALGLSFIQHETPSKTLSPWEKYAQVLLLANEFVFVD